MQTFKTILHAQFEKLRQKKCHSGDYSNIAEKKSSKNAYLASEVLISSLLAIFHL